MFLSGHVIVFRLADIGLSKPHEDQRNNTMKQMKSTTKTKNEEERKQTKWADTEHDLGQGDIHWKS